MCEQEREQANLAPGQDQDGSQQQGWKGPWTRAHVHTWDHKLGSIVFPHQSFRGSGSRSGCSRAIFAYLKLEPRSALAADEMSFLSLLLF